MFSKYVQPGDGSSVFFLPPYGPPVAQLSGSVIFRFLRPWGLGPCLHTQKSYTSFLGPVAFVIRRIPQVPSAPVRRMGNRPVLPWYPRSWYLLPIDVSSAVARQKARRGFRGAVWGRECSPQSGPIRRHSYSGNLFLRRTGQIHNLFCRRIHSRRKYKSV